MTVRKFAFDTYKAFIHLFLVSVSSVVVVVVVVVGGGGGGLA